MKVSFFLLHFLIRLGCFQLLMLVCFLLVKDLIEYSRSLPRAQMGNGVHFVFFIDFVLLKGAESKTIDWFFKSCAQTRPQAHPQILHRKKNKFSKHLEVWYQWKENLILTKKHVKNHALKLIPSQDMADHRFWCFLEYYFYSPEGESRVWYHGILLLE